MSSKKNIFFTFAARAAAQTTLPSLPKLPATAIFPFPVPSPSSSGSFPLSVTLGPIPAKPFRHPRACPGGLRHLRLSLLFRSCPHFRSSFPKLIHSSSFPCFSVPVPISRPFPKTYPQPRPIPFPLVLPLTLIPTPGYFYFFSFASFLFFLFAFPTIIEKSVKILVPVLA